MGKHEVFIANDAEDIACLENYLKNSDLDSRFNDFLKDMKRILSFRFGFHHKELHDFSLDKARKEDFKVLFLFMIDKFKIIHQNDFFFKVIRDILYVFLIRFQGKLSTDEKIHCHLAATQFLEKKFLECLQFLEMASSGINSVFPEDHHFKDIPEFNILLSFARADSNSPLNKNKNERKFPSIH